MVSEHSCARTLASVFCVAWLLISRTLPVEEHSDPPLSRKDCRRLWQRVGGPVRPLVSLAWDAGILARTVLKALLVRGGVEQHPGPAQDDSTPKIKHWSRQNQEWALLQAEILTKDCTIKSHAATLLRMCEPGGVVGRHVLRMYKTLTTSYSTDGPYDDYNTK